MFKSFTQQGLVKNVIFMGTILTTTFNVNAAEAVKDNTDLTASNTQSSEAIKKKPVVRTAQDLAQNNEEVMTVTETMPDKKPGSKTTITAAEMQRKGGNDFGTIMRYEPLITATGASGGSEMAKAASTAAVIPAITSVDWKATASVSTSTVFRSQTLPGAATSAVRA